MPTLSRIIALLMAGMMVVLPAWNGASAASEDAPRDSVTYRDDRATFSIRVEENVIPYRIFGVYVMPGETVPVRVLFPNRKTAYTIDAEAGSSETVGEHEWTWTAPDTPGVYPVTVRSDDGGTIQLNAFVLTPHDHKKRRLDGYRIGTYKAKAYKNLPNYRRPEGFIRLTPETRSVKVSPHFTLEQFRCKQGKASSNPQFLLLDERLLLKLEMILREVNEKGFSVSTLHIMSGYRTPFYNRSIGNRTSYSRHLYGGAADIFVDADGNGRMDDLNGDGRTTKADAEVLADIVRAKAKETWYRPMVGGMGVYGPAPHRGPFVHVDVRGYKARW